MKNETYDTRRHYYCLILAGGKGRRLWPLSREGRPKQFIDFFGTGKTLLQQTYERFAKFIPEENIIVSTFSEYVDIVREQLPQLTASQLLSEPIRRNTAPIAAWATHRITMRDPQATFIISPSDQLIFNEEAYQQDVLNGLAHAEQHHCLLTLGIKPSRPEPGYGYLQIGDTVETDFYRVQSFTEKPEREFAEMFMKSGEFLWNTGLYIANAKSIRERLETLLPPVMRTFDEEHTSATWQEEGQWMEEHYATYPNISLESGILERSRDVCVKECHFGWADIGAWHGIYEAMASSPVDNVIMNTDAQISDTTGCVISLSEGHTAVINGLHNYIVVEHDDVLLITPRADTSSEVVKLMTKHDIG